MDHVTLGDLDVEYPVINRFIWIFLTPLFGGGSGGGSGGSRGGGGNDDYDDDDDALCKHSA